MIRVHEEIFDPGAELDRFTRAQSDAGTIVSFLGVVRSEAQAVTRLELQHYPGFTEREIAKIAADAQRSFAIAEPLIIHRFGTLLPGEPIVLVAAASRHRREAFNAADYLMDRLKTEAPFWKREIGPDGARWIEARSEDHHDRNRWENGNTNVADR